MKNLTMLVRTQKFGYGDFQYFFDFVVIIGGMVVTFEKQFGRN